MRCIKSDNLVSLKIIKIIIFILLLIVSVNTINAQDYNANNKILIVTSYTSDSKRVTEFINEIERMNNETNNKYSFVMENMELRGFNEYKNWGNILTNIFSKYDTNSLKCIIVLGQEAWSTLLSMKNVPNIPFYACYVSENGILLNDTTTENSYWLPESINTIDTARNRFKTVGGTANTYDIAGNINLIRSLYPSINNIAFISDNTYGGVSLQALVRKTMQNDYPDMGLTLIDGRVCDINQIKDQINRLPENTAVLIGTWRVSKDGTFFLQSSINTLFSEDFNLPVFTVAGVGFGTIAIGGYFPAYDANINTMINKIINDTKYDSFALSQNKFVFSKEMMVKYGVSPFQLPPDSEIISEATTKLHRLEQYIMFGGSTIAVIVIFIFILYVKNKKVNKILEAQQSILERQKEELYIAKEEAIKSDKLKSAFLANMSHEIRTPLNAIVGFSELIKDTEDTEEREQYWNIISTNNELLLRLINDILDLSKIEAGMIDLRPSTFDVTAKFNSIYSSLCQRYSDDEIDFRCITPYDSCIVELDENRMTQLITNFVTNAFKFTSKGSITIGYEYMEGGIKIYCQDTGIGISPELVEKVFARFHKLNDLAQGSGLGMAICKAIVDAQSGKINVESQNGLGSLFWAWIPCNAIINNIEKS